MNSNNKIKVALMYGGKSPEHEVSIQSAKNVFQAISRQKYDIYLIYIDKNGHWFLDKEERLLEVSDYKEILIDQSFEKVSIVPGREEYNLYNFDLNSPIGKADVVFSVLHGTYGEDGNMQGLLNISSMPFVGASVLGAAVGMDKAVAKSLLRDAGIDVGDFLVFYKNEEEKINFIEVKDRLEMPVFIKPANQGSSVGINKVKNENEFHFAIEEAFKYDNKIIIEAFVSGREIECAVLGNDNLEASVQGEIVMSKDHEFYSYDAKYIDENGAKLIAPAVLEDDISDKIKEMAKKVFKVLSCSGMARVDFFVDGENIYVNEINTIPGFTKISMYPKLWGLSGVSYEELIDRLIQLAISRFNEEQQLKSSKD